MHKTIKNTKDNVYILYVQEPLSIENGQDFLDILDMFKDNGGIQIRIRIT